MLLDSLNSLFLVANNISGNLSGTANSLWDALSNSLSTFGSTFLDGFIKIIAALLILFIGRIIARVIRTAIEKLLTVARFNEGSEKVGLTDMLRKGSITASPSGLLAKFVYYIIMLFVFIAACDFLGWTQISQKFSDLIDYLPRLFIGAVIFTLGYWLASFVRDFILAGSKSLGSSTGSIIGTIVFYFLLMMTTIMALDQAGIDTSFVTGNIQIILGAILLAMALAYGLAARGTMEDLISGFFKKSKIAKGQRIRVKDVEGEVIELDNVSVTVRTANDTVVVPMKDLAQNNVHLLG